MIIFFLGKIKKCNLQKILIMKRNYIKLLSTLSMLFAFYTFGQGSFNVPEIIYYQFDQAGSSSAQNSASPGTSGAGTINGSLTQSGIGQFSTALEGTGQSSTTNNINNKSHRRLDNLLLVRYG